jgi:hypothetical protein
MSKPVVVISNMDTGDITFEGVPHGTWNITRALADCKAGKHKLYLHDVAELLAHSDTIEVDQAKVDRYAGELELEKFELILVVWDGMVWLIDGAHHLRAMSQRGLKHCRGYVIEEKDTARYRVLYNGKPNPPWAKGPLA